MMSSDHRLEAELLHARAIERQASVLSADRVPALGRLAMRTLRRNQMYRYRVVIFQKSYTAGRSRYRRSPAGARRADGIRSVRQSFRRTAERADRLRRMIDRVDAVTVSTPELAKAIGPQCTVIDDALDSVEPWRAGRCSRRWWPRRGPLRLAWFGNAGQDDPPFGLIDLARIRPQLESLHARRPIHVTVISNSRNNSIVT